MEKSDKITDIKDIISKIFKYSKNMPSIELIKMRKQWKEIIGDQLCEHTFPGRFSKNCLTVYCDHQGWINNLQFHKNDILKNIEQKFGNEIQISDIKFIYSSSGRKDNKS